MSLSIWFQCMVVYQNVTEASPRYISPNRFIVLVQQVPDAAELRKHLGGYADLCETAHILWFGNCSSTEYLP